MRHLKPGDFFIFLISLFFIVFSFLKNQINISDTVLIQSSGEQYKYSLDKNQHVNVEGPLGITVVEIKDGKARIVESPCKNKTCMAQGFSKTIVCLPNRVMVTLESEEEFDAVAQ